MRERVKKYLSVIISLLLVLSVFGIKMENVLHREYWL